MLRSNSAVVFRDQEKAEAEKGKERITFYYVSTRERRKKKFERMVEVRIPNQYNIGYR